MTRTRILLAAGLTLLGLTACGSNGSSLAEDLRTRASLREVGVDGEIANCMIKYWHDRDITFDRVETDLLRPMTWCMGLPD